MLAKACGAASSLITVKVIESSNGAAPHHVSLGTSSTTCAASSYVPTSNGPVIQSLLIGPIHPLLYVSGSAYDAAGASDENSAS